VRDSLGMTLAKIVTVAGFIFFWLTALVLSLAVPIVLIWAIVKLVQKFA
jgi:flagellar biogenesis protein FliO